MSAITTYRQCELRRPTTGEVDVVWIPSPYAKRGKWLRVGDVNGWVVSDVYGGTTLTGDEMIRRRENHGRFRWVLGE
jgi:hypothetical protein